MLLESLLRRDRWLTFAALVVIILLSWAYLLSGAGMGMSAWDMTRMPGHMDMAMAPVQWTPDYVVLMFFMWWIMMIAMMLPSAAPVVLLAAALNRRSNPGKTPYGTAGFFILGYLLAWAGFSLVAVGAQWLLQINDALSGMLAVNHSIIAGMLLIAAAAWQFTPLKQVCLQHCRTPVKFLTQRRRPGNRGALLMGLEHGIYCVGCCWFLMALLFVGGVMNLFWIVGLAIFVLVEKLLPAGRHAGYLMAWVLGIWGSLILLAPVLTPG